MDETHLKCIIETEEKEMCRNLSHCYSNELRKVFLLFFFVQGGPRLHQSRCEKFHSCWR